MKLESYQERLEYLKLGDGNVKSPRHISNPFYKSHLWKTVRDEIIKRDLGCDLGVFGEYIDSEIIVHHINPINEYDILNHTDKLFDEENLICTSVSTHNKIHYAKRYELYHERTEGDTILW